MSSTDIDITLSWESPLPVDDLPTVQAYILLKSIGVSNSSIMRKLGYDPDEEMRLSAAATRNPLSESSVLTLAKKRSPTPLYGFGP